MCVLNHWLAYQQQSRTCSTGFLAAVLSVHSLCSFQTRQLSSFIKCMGIAFSLRLLFWGRARPLGCVRVKVKMVLSMIARDDCVS